MLPMSPFLLMARRLIVLFLLASWWGGFTFYALAVIPSGSQVLHSNLRQGFITQRVTMKLNLLGAVTIAAALTEVLAARQRARVFHFLLSAWLICLASQMSLFCLHIRMDALLDSARMTILDQDGFDFLHQVYLWPATIGWMASGAILGFLAWPGNAPCDTWNYCVEGESPSSQPSHRFHRAG